MNFLFVFVQIVIDSKTRFVLRNTAGLTASRLYNGYQFQFTIVEYLPNYQLPTEEFRTIIPLRAAQRPSAEHFPNHHTVAGGTAAVQQNRSESSYRRNTVAVQRKNSELSYRRGWHGGRSKELS